MSLLQRVASALRLDGWLNVTTGVGGGLKTAFKFEPDARLSDQELEDIFAGDSFGARVCDAIPKHALRQPPRVRLGLGDPGAETALASVLTGYDAFGKLGVAWTWGRLFGGGLVLVGADDGLDPRLPLAHDRIRSIRFVTALDKTEADADTYVSDPLSPRFGEVETYRFNRTGGHRVDTRVVHASRLIRFGGALTTRRRRRMNAGWDDSELQRVFSKLVAFNGAFGAVATLLQDASQGVFMLKGLYEMMSGDKEDLTKKRIALMDLSRSVARSIMVDADEEDYKRVEASFAGVPDTLDRFLVLLAGASEIPVTILMGQAPAGLNATGDSDVRNFYDRVRSEQTHVLAPRLLHLARLFCLAHDGPTGGVVPPGLAVEFPSLYQLTPKEEADRRKTVADTDAVYLSAQVVTPAEVATARFRAEGWSPEMQIDLDVRRAAQDADATAAAAGDPSQPAPLPAGPDPEHAQGVADVIERVASRAIDRTAGVGMLQTMYGLTPDQAETVMGETGKSYFTTPEPGHAAELASAKQQLAAAQRSQQSTKAMLARVLERNKAGELVLGNLIAKPPTDTSEGDVLEEGDVVAVPAEASTADDPAQKTDGGAPALRTVRADAFAQRALRTSLRLDGELSTGVAIVLPLRPETAQAAAVPGGESAPDLHVTLAFFGAALGVTPDTLATIRTALAAWSATQPPIDGWLAGQGRFLAPEGEPDPVYLTPDCPALSAARERLVNALTAAGVAPADTHGFVPHVTVAYAPKGTAAPPAPSTPIALTFGDVGLWCGPTRETFALGGV